MKHTLTLLVLFVALIAQSCSNEKIENDWTRDNIQGKVLSYSEFSYEAENRFGNIEKGERNRQFSIEYDHQIKYDEKGNEIEYNGYNSDGSLDFKYTYKYDEKGNKIEENFYHSDGSLARKWTYKYDEKGNKIEGNEYNSDGSLDSKKTYKYDEKGNKIEENEYNSDGSLDFKYTYKYDEKGNKIEENFYHSDGSLARKWTYKYDEKGNKIEGNEYNSDGSLDSKKTSKYDEKGNEIEYNGYNSDGSLNSKKTYKYQFDKQGNWIKRIEFTNGIPEYILERQYEYYDYITPYENNATAGDDVSDGSNVSSSKDYKDDDYDDDLPEMPEKNKIPVKSSNKKETKLPKKLNSNSTWTNWKSNFCQTCTDSKGSPSSIKTGVLCKDMIDGGGICTKFDLSKIVDDFPTLKNIHGVTQSRFTKRELFSNNGELFFNGESSITNGLNKKFKLKKKNGVWFFYDDEKVGGAGWIKLSDYYNTSNQTKEINSNGSTKFPNVEKAKVICKWCNKKVPMIESVRVGFGGMYRLKDGHPYENNILFKEGGELKSLEIYLRKNGIKSAKYEIMPSNMYLGDNGSFYCSRKCGSNHED